MRYIAKSCLLAAAVLFLLSGCAGGPVTFKPASAKDVALNTGRPISGESCGFQLLLLIPIGVNGRLERAYQDLKEKAGNDVIANVGIEEYWRYAFVGTVYCTKLDATAYSRTAAR